MEQAVSSLSELGFLTTLQRVLSESVLVSAANTRSHLSLLLPIASPSASQSFHLSFAKDIPIGNSPRCVGRCFAPQ
jgi:hypothetical protein